MELKILDKIYAALGHSIDPRTGFAIHFNWYAPGWDAWGWFDPYADFGIGVLVLGPVRIRVSWPLEEWPLLQSSAR